MKNYSDEVFGRMVMIVRKDNDLDREWMINNGHRELLEFWDAIENMEGSFKWLLENNFKQLAAAVDAIHGDDKAKLFLMKCGERDLAAFVDACSGSKTAISFLLKQDQKGWLLVAKEIYDKDAKAEKGGIWGMLFNLGNPFR